MSLVIRFVEDESATTGIEYAFIGTFMSIAVISGASTIGAKLAGYFSAIAAGL